MNKYLLLTAAAATAVTTGAGVAQATTTVHLNSYCDYFRINANSGGLLAAQHVGAVSCSTATWNNDAGVGPYKKGTVPKKPKSGVVVFADVTLDRVGFANNGSAWVFSTPFGTTGTWAIVATESSTASTVLVLNSGNQSKHAPNSHKTSLAGFVKTMRSN
jgi:hypothetical protein